MELCIHNRNLFKHPLLNDDLMKNQNLDKLFDFKKVAFNDQDNL